LDARRGGAPSWQAMSRFKKLRHFLIPGYSASAVANRLRACLSSVAIGVQRRGNYQRGHWGSNSFGGDRALQKGNLKIEVRRRTGGQKSITRDRPDVPPANILKLKCPCLCARPGPLSAAKQTCLISQPMSANDPIADCRCGSQKKKSARQSAIECQIRGHGCGVVVLKAIEQHITAEQDERQQTISKIGRRSGPVIAHIRWIPVLANPPLSFLWSSLRVQLPRRLRTPWRVNSPYSWTQRSSRIR
jgi:hypothetical protein